MHDLLSNIDAFFGEHWPDITATVTVLGALFLMWKNRTDSAVARITGKKTLLEAFEMQEQRLADLTVRVESLEVEHQALIEAVEALAPRDMAAGIFRRAHIVAQVRKLKKDREARGDQARDDRHEGPAAS